MSRVRVMYWKEIPVQVQAEDGPEQVSKLLDDRFQKGVDAVSMFDGSSGSDAYLSAWEWGEFTEMDESAEEAAAAIADSYDSGFPKNFVARIRALHESGDRDPTPGAIDHWLGDDID